MRGGAARQRVRRFYEQLHQAFGPQHWWPADTRDEILIGAILTQNTAWANVERAIQRLRNGDCLSLGAVRALSAERLAELIRPAGTFRVKARRLKAFVEWFFARFGGDWDRMFRASPDDLRDELLSVAGIGPETADSILLYIGGVPTFVVDAYAKRVLRRHFLIDGSDGYDAVKDVFERNLPADAVMFNEYHALLVELGKRHCRPAARCRQCPLRRFAHDETL